LIFPAQQLPLPLFHLSLPPRALGDPVTVIAGFLDPPGELSLSPLPCTCPRPSPRRPPWCSPHGAAPMARLPPGAAPWRGSLARPQRLDLARPRRLALAWSLCAPPAWPPTRLARLWRAACSRACSTNACGD
jgi:hypothetical protein